MNRKYKEIFQFNFLKVNFLCVFIDITLSFLLLKWTFHKILVYDKYVMSLLLLANCNGPHDIHVQFS